MINILALVLSVVVAVWVFNLVGGGFGGFVAAVGAFIGMGWAIVLVVPKLFGMSPTSSKTNLDAIHEFGVWRDGDEEYFGDVRCVHFGERGEDVADGSGFFGLSDRRYYLGNGRYGRVTDVHFVDMESCSVEPKRSKLQNESIDITVSVAVDSDAHQAALDRGDSEAAKALMHQVAFFVIDRTELHKFNEIMEEREQKFLRLMDEEPPE